MTKGTVYLFSFPLAQVLDFAFHSWIALKKNGYKFALLMWKLFGENSVKFNAQLVLKTKQWELQQFVCQGWKRMERGGEGWRQYHKIYLDLSYTVLRLGKLFSTV